MPKPTYFHLAIKLCNRNIFEVKHGFMCDQLRQGSSIGYVLDQRSEGRQFDSQPIHFGLFLGKTVDFTFSSVHPAVNRGPGIKGRMVM